MWWDFSEIRFIVTLLFGSGFAMWDQMGHVPSALILETNKTLESGMDLTPTIAVYQLVDF